ncbi:MAG: hypothetical protein ACOYK6_07115, partial [Chthoniobacterales bacterium]
EVSFAKRFKRGAQTRSVANNTRERDPRLRGDDVRSDTTRRGLQNFLKCSSSRHHSLCRDTKLF